MVNKRRQRQHSYGYSGPHRQLLPQPVSVPFVSLDARPRVNLAAAAGKQRVAQRLALLRLGGRTLGDALVLLLRGRSVPGCEQQ